MTAGAWVILGICCIPAAYGMWLHAREVWDLQARVARIETAWADNFGQTEQPEQPRRWWLISNYTVDDDTQPMPPIDVAGGARTRPTPYKRGRHAA